MNPWLFAFLIGLILFLLLVDRCNLARNLWAGFTCMVFQLRIDMVQEKLNYFHYLRVYEGLTKLMVFSNSVNIFLLGTVFMMGILFVQLLPKNYFLQLIHASVWLILFRLMHQFAEQNNMIEFIYWKVWKYFYIIPAQMLPLAWLKNILDERKKSPRDDYTVRNTIK